MAPIYDTDLAEERWAKAEWQHLELWEKIEIRLKHKRWLWIGATAAMFFALSAVPIFIDRVPKWRTHAAVRRLAGIVSELKRSAAIEAKAFRVRIEPIRSTAYVIERGTSCSQSIWSEVRRGNLIADQDLGKYLVLDPSFARALEIPSVVTEFCYDPVSGSLPALQGQTTVGLGILPVTDLTDQRVDRLSILILSGQSAEISFE